VYKDCPENGNTALIPTCCSCKLVYGEELSRLHARQGRDSKEKVTESAETITGRVFSSSHTNRGLSFAAELCSNTQ
jgi:hypothetical protein